VLGPDVPYEEELSKGWNRESHRVMEANEANGKIVVVHA
jgi:hypothetical protein